MFVVSWCSVFMVEMVVDAAAVSAFGDFVAGHAYISGVAELETVFAH